MKFEELFKPKPGSLAAEMQKTIDGLNQEIKELQAHAERVGHANDRLVVENAALRGDKERLDWLTNTGCWLTFPVLSKRHNWKHGTARDVIDLARKESE